MDKLNIKSRATKLAETTVTGHPTSPKKPVITISPIKQHIIEITIQRGRLKIYSNARIKNNKIQAPKTSISL